MSVMLAEQEQKSSRPEDVERVVRRRIEDAQEYRRPFELGWQMSLAFAAGQQWTVVNRTTRQLQDIREVDPRYQGQDLYTADFIWEHRGAALGELQTDSDRPELVPPGDGDEDEHAQLLGSEANRLLGHGWDFEWEGDAKLREARQYCIDLGVAAVRCRFDPTVGQPVTGTDGQPVQAPVDPATGQPIVDPEQARQHVLENAMAGRNARFQELREGKVLWETGTAFNILAPPAVPHEDKFPWEVWVAPVPLADVKAMFPAAADLVADTDIGSALGSTAHQQPTRDRASGPRLNDHVWLYTYYERPCPAYPKGRTVVVAGGQKKLLRVTDQLPYQRVNGDWHSGIVYLHWQRLTDRFYSRSLIDALKDPQRMTNRVATQTQEILDRGMPFILIEEDTLPQKPSGKPVEYVEVKKGTQVQPQVHGGIGPGEWMYRHRQQLLEDAQHASTLSALKLGENPASITTYSQLALIYEQEASKRSTIRVDHQQKIALLAELAMEDIRRYWPEGKQLMVAGQQNTLQAVTFTRQMIPPLYVVRPAKGSPRPRAQAAQLQLITDLWNAAVASGAATMDPVQWMDWLAHSYDAGEPLPLPEPPTDQQSEKAQLENRAILQGETVPVAYYDRVDLHIPVHRSGQDQALMAGDIETWQRFEEHVQQHRQVAAENAAHIAAMQPAPAAIPAGQQPGPQPQPQPS